uniref:HDC07667 n=1 Tax=Drosophila melanogaster TaxID=7227 RepID=Q6IM26_DROME|nr:TPA_inf: HDC07667 [Drosophila melanogaster]
MWRPPLEMPVTPSIPTSIQIWSSRDASSGDELQQVTKPDILWAARSLKAIKVPGPDQTPNKATKLLWSIHLKETIDLFSKCLRERERFPTDGSASGQAVLLYKSGKPPGA